MQAHSSATADISMPLLSPHTSASLCSRFSCIWRIGLQKWHTKRRLGTPASNDALWRRRRHFVDDDGPAPHPPVMLQPTQSQVAGEDLGSLTEQWGLPLCVSEKGSLVFESCLIREFQLLVPQFGSDQKGVY